MKNIFCSILLLLILGSCAKNAEFYFEKMLTTPKLEAGQTYCPLYSYDLHTGTENYYQDKLFKMGTAINSFLLEKAKGNAPTNYMIENIVCPLTDGDIAIDLLLDINLISDNVFAEELVPDSIKEEYRNNGASVWWEWIHESASNRAWVIDAIMKTAKRQNQP